MFACQKKLVDDIKRCPAELGKFLVLKNEICLCDEHWMCPTVPDINVVYNLDVKSSISNEDSEKIKHVSKQYQDIQKILTRQDTTMISIKEINVSENDCVDSCGNFLDDVYSAICEKMIFLMDSMYTKYARKRAGM